MSHLRSPRVLAVLIAFLLAGAGLGLMLTIGLGSGTAAPAPAPSPAPCRRSRQRAIDGPWTRCFAGARAGEVDAISAMTPGAGSGLSAPIPAPVLIVRTTSGAIYAIRPEVPIGDALDVIRAAGYARLLTDEAIALDTVPSAGGLPTLLGFAMSVSVLVILVLMFVRLRGGSARSWRPSGGVQRRRRTDQPIAGERPNVTLADVAGVEEAKLELTETIEFLRDPTRFVRLGATAIRGVMLYGPPGTGKTLLAKAVAAEADVPFYSVSGSEFVEKYVGVAPAGSESCSPRPGPPAVP